MNKTRLAGQLLIAFVLLQGCSIFGDCRELKPILPGMERWIPYENQRVMYFESTVGKDTLMVEHFNHGFYDGSGYKCRDHIEFISVRIKSSQAFSDTLELNLSYGIITANTSTDPGLWIQYKIGGTSPYSLSGEAAYHESISYDGKTFNDVIVAGCSDCQFLKEMSFVINKGIIAFKVGDVQWTRLP